MSSQLRPARRRALPIIVIATIAVALVAAGALLYALRPGAGPLASILVSPAAVLFTAPGESRRLVAEGIDSAGRTVEVEAPRWTSTREATVTVTPDGTVTAQAIGSAQVVVDGPGGMSASILVVVSRPAQGVVLVDDAQVVGQPADVDPTAEPSPENLYRVTLRGLVPAVGDRLLGSGGQPIAGEVVAAAASGGETVVTLRVVPVHELLPDLLLVETFDLASAPIEIPDDIRRLYDIQRDGASLTFTPKAEFMDLIAAGGGLDRAAGTRLAVALDRQRALGPVAAADAGASGASIALQADDPEVEFDIGPFECTATVGLIPIELEAPPAFSVELVPTLDIQYTPQDRLRHWRVSLQATGKVDVGLKATAAFEGKVTCERDIYTIQIPVAGALSIFFAGLLPVNVGLELAGKVTLSTLEIGGEASAKATGRLGIVCVPGGGCDVDRELSDVTTEFKPRLDGPAVEDFRLETSFEASIGVEGAVGSPLLSSLRLDLAKAKVGARIGGDWAPRVLQIADADYASSYKLSLEGGVSVGAELDGIASMLGLESLTGVELKVTRDLSVSPTGSLTADRPRYEAGDDGRASVVFDQANVTFLGVYNVEEVLLVRSVGGQVTGLDAITANAGQTRFDFDFIASGPIAASELHAFVVTRWVPVDFLQLQLAQNLPPSATVTVETSDEIGVEACERIGSPNESCRAAVGDGTSAWSQHRSAGDTEEGVSGSSSAMLGYAVTMDAGSATGLAIDSVIDALVNGRSGVTEADIDFFARIKAEGTGTVPFSLAVDFQFVGDGDLTDCQISFVGPGLEYEHECDGSEPYHVVVPGTLAAGEYEIAIDGYGSAVTKEDGPGSSSSRLKIEVRLVFA